MNTQDAFIRIAMVLGALGALIAVVKVLQSRRIAGDETARKMVHIGMGMICLTFPLLFSATWPVWVLAGLAVIALSALRLVPWMKCGAGTVLHAVNRNTLGEIYFPLGVAAVFTLAKDDPLKFTIPVSLLTFADAAGALVGKRWGRHPYQTLEGQKSIEGSVAVGITAFLCATVPLVIAQRDLAASLVIGVLIGIFGMVVEAISWRGLDNVFLPLAALAQVSIYLALPMPALALRLPVLLAIIGSACWWHRCPVADSCARLGGALAIYFFWTVGGWTWLIAPLALLGSYLWLMPAPPDDDPPHNMMAMICISSVGLVWAVAQSFTPGTSWLWWFTLGITAHHAMITATRFSQRRGRWSRMTWWAAGTIQAVVVQAAVFALMDRGRSVSVAEMVAGFGCVALVTACFVMCEQNLPMPADLNVRWWKQGTTALVASIAGGAMMFLL